MLQTASEAAGVAVAARSGRIASTAQGGRGPEGEPLFADAAWTVEQKRLGEPTVLGGTRQSPPDLLVAGDLEVIDVSHGTSVARVAGRRPGC